MSHPKHNNKQHHSSSSHHSHEHHGHSHGGELVKNLRLMPYEKNVWIFKSKHRKAKTEHASQEAPYYRQALRLNFIFLIPFAASLWFIGFVAIQAALPSMWISLAAIIALGHMMAESLVYFTGNQDIWEKLLTLFWDKQNVEFDLTSLQQHIKTHWQKWLASLVVFACTITFTAITYTHTTAAMLIFFGIASLPVWANLAILFLICLPAGVVFSFCSGSAWFELIDHGFNEWSKALRSIFTPPQNIAGKSLTDKVHAYLPFAFKIIFTTTVVGFLFVACGITITTTASTYFTACNDSIVSALQFMTNIQQGITWGATGVRWTASGISAILICAAFIPTKATFFFHNSLKLLASLTLENLSKAARTYKKAFQDKQAQLKAEPHLVFPFIVWDCLFITAGLGTLVGASFILHLLAEACVGGEGTTGLAKPFCWLSNLFSQQISAPIGQGLGNLCHGLAGFFNNPAVTQGVIINNGAVELFADLGVLGGENPPEPTTAVPSTAAPTYSLPKPKPLKHKLSQATHNDHTKSKSAIENKIRPVNNFRQTATTHLSRNNTGPTTVKRGRKP